MDVNGLVKIHIIFLMIFYEDVIESAKKKQYSSDGGSYKFFARFLKTADLTRIVEHPSNYGRRQKFLVTHIQIQSFFSGGGGGRGDWGRNEFRFYKGDRSIGGEIKKTVVY